MKTNIHMAARVTVILLLMSSSVGWSISSGRPQVLDDALKADDVAVRFYYSPIVNGSGKYHAPIVVLPVSTQDPRLGTRPELSLYVTLTDLRLIINALSNSQLHWRQSPHPTLLLVHPSQLPPQHLSMEIVVTTPEQSTTAEVEPGKICVVLEKVVNAPLDAQARDILAFYRDTVNCPRPRDDTSKETN